MSGILCILNVEKVGNIMYINRTLEKPIQEAIRQFPVVLITGARQAGKSTLLQQTLKNYNYVTFDDLLIRNLAKSDPELFLKIYQPPIIIDEIQYVPSLLSWIKLNIDANRHNYGQYVLTGSQIFALMKGVSESLAGRIAIFHLYPLSWKEIPNVDLYNEKLMLQQTLKGFYPEFQIQTNLNTKYWHSSYISTYIERDLHLIRSIHDLSKFQQYLVLLASRCGQLLNLSEISKECGISQTTAKDWLNLLKTSYVIYCIEPYARNITKRIVKSPKLFFIDTGLLCYLLRIENVEQLVHSPFRRHVFENMVIMEKIKTFAGNAERAPCYFYRTISKLEIDLIIDCGNTIEAYEIKFTSSPSVGMTKSLEKFKEEHKVKKAALINLRRDSIPFANGIIAEHWNKI